MASIICKLSYDDETRRFTTPTDKITYDTMHLRAKELFSFSEDAKFKLQYKDDEGDVITMSTNEEMNEALSLAVASYPPVLRVSVKMEAEKKDTPTAPKAPAPKAPPVATEHAGASPDLSALLKNIGEHLPNMFEPSTDGAPPDLSGIAKKIKEELPAFVETLPECIRAQIGNAELDVEASLAASAPAVGGAKVPGGVSFSVLPDGGYGDHGVHPGVTCDKSGMCPIIGPRYNLKGHNYDLCEAEFNKLEPAEQAKFVKIDPPFGRMPGGKGMGGMGIGGKWRSAATQGVHPGVSCDKSGMNPIIGPRYNLKGHNYDLCEAEFNKLEPAEQAKFVKIEPPCGPWRAMSWGKGKGKGMGGKGMCKGMGHGGKGHHSTDSDMGGDMGGHHTKLAARFVSDVSIFDGTQMSPGTEFTKIWRIKNVGEMPWPAGTKLLFVGGDQMAAELTVPLGDDNKTVMPGEEVDVAVDMVAPSELGRYLGYWRLVGPHGRRRFGQRVWCHIQVVDPSVGDVPHDANAIAAEISNLMAKAQKDDLDADDEVDAAAAVSSCSSGLSSAVSSATSSAVSVRKEEALLPAAPKEVKVAAAKEEPKGKPKEQPNEEPEEKPKEEPKSADAVAAPASHEEDVATELLGMGFDQKSVELVMEKNSVEGAGLLEACTRDLLQLSEWDSMLSDLEEMGFENRELNTRLMVKNNGSVKRTVKDLVADAM